MAELADAQDLKSCGGDIVPVRFRSAAFCERLILKGIGLFIVFGKNISFVRAGEWAVMGIEACKDGFFI